jgi:hypothetical protein
MSALAKKEKREKDKREYMRKYMMRRYHSDPEFKKRWIARCKKYQQSKLGKAARRRYYWKNREYYMQYAKEYRKRQKEKVVENENRMPELQVRIRSADEKSAGLGDAECEKGKETESEHHGDTGAVHGKEGSE